MKEIRSIAVYGVSWEFKANIGKSIEFFFIIRFHGISFEFEFLIHWLLWALKGKYSAFSHSPIFSSYIFSFSFCVCGDGNSNEEMRRESRINSNSHARVCPLYIWLMSRLAAAVEFDMKPMEEKNEILPKPIQTTLDMTVEEEKKFRRQDRREERSKWEEVKDKSSRFSWNYFEMSFFDAYNCIFGRDIRETKWMISKGKWKFLHAKT